MKNNKMLRRVTAILFAVSIAVYLLQLVIFRDPRTTFFYIFQDFAFLPVSIAIATVAVGAILDERDRIRKIDASRMLRSTFFTGIGAQILMKMRFCSTCSQNLYEIMQVEGSTDTLRERRELHRKIRERQEMIKSLDLRVHLNEEVYDGVCCILKENRTELMIMSANDNLMVEESFTEMIWGLFHLIDEFRLRGTWSELSQEDIEHMEDDFTLELKLLLANSVGNNWFLRETYPEFYGAAREWLFQSKPDQGGEK